MTTRKHLNAASRIKQDIIDYDVHWVIAIGSYTKWKLINIMTGRIHRHYSTWVPVWDVGNMVRGYIEDEIKAGNIMYIPRKPLRVAPMRQS